MCNRCGNRWDSIALEQGRDTVIDAPGNDGRSCDRSELGKYANDRPAHELRGIWLQQGAKQVQWVAALGFGHIRRTGGACLCPAWATHTSTSLLVLGSRSMI